MKDADLIPLAVLFLMFSFAVVFMLIFSVTTRLLEML